MNFHYVTILDERFLNPWPRDHDYLNLGSGQHEYHNHEFSSYPPAMDVEKTIIYDLIYFQDLAIFASSKGLSPWPGSHGFHNFVEGFLR